MPLSDIDQDYDSDLPDLITLTDETGKSLECYIEQDLEIDGYIYMLLLPVDQPVVILAWDEEDEDELSDAIIIEEEEELQKIFPDAKAVLAELDLQLKHTAFTLTISGQLPALQEDDLLTLELEDEAGEDGEIPSEELQFLTNFYHLEQLYAIYTPLTPILFFSRMDHRGNLEVLEPEDPGMQHIFEMLMFED